MFKIVSLILRHEMWLALLITAVLAVTYGLVGTDGV